MIPRIVGQLMAVAMVAMLGWIGWQWFQINGHKAEAFQLKLQRGCPRSRCCSTGA